VPSAFSLDPKPQLRLAGLSLSTTLVCPNCRQEFIGNRGISFPCRYKRGHQIRFDPVYSAGSFADSCGAIPANSTSADTFRGAPGAVVAFHSRNRGEDGQEPCYGGPAGYIRQTRLVTVQPNTPAEAPSGRICTWTEHVG
jgi:hypothetical protein